MAKKNNPAAKNEKAVVVSPNTIATQPASNGSVAQNVNSDLTLSPILTATVDQEKVNENVVEMANTGAAEQNVNPDLMLSPIFTPEVGQEKTNENTVETANTGAAEQNVNPDLMLSQDEIFLDDAPEKPIGIPGLEVQSKQAGFRRAGRAWSTEVTFVAAEDLTREQAEALLDEPMLIVTPVYKA